MAVARRVGRQEPQLRRRRLRRLLPDARRDPQPGRLQGLPREARAAGQVVPRPGRGGQEAAHRARPVGRPTRSSSATGSRTSSAPPSSTAAATSCASARPTGCSARRGPGSAPSRRRRAAAAPRPPRPPRPRTPPPRAAGGGGGAGPKALAALKEAQKYKGTRVQVGRLDPADRLRLLRPRAVGLREGRHPDPARHRRAVRRRQRREGRRGDLKPGDLVFFGTPGNIYHVGISMGGDKFLHAPKTGDVVKVASLKESYFSQNVRGRPPLRRRHRRRRARRARPRPSPPPRPRARRAGDRPARPSPRRRPPSRATPPRSTARAPACSWRSRRRRRAATRPSSS